VIASSEQTTMKFGIVPAHGPEHMAVAIEQVRLCRLYEFDSVWIEEHHAPGPYWASPLLAVAALVPHLDGMTIGTDVLVLPLHDPVHVAEQAATLDRMTNGHFVLGVGLGDTASEFATFRVPARLRGARFEEQLEIIRALWSGGTVSYKGVFYELENAQLGTFPLTAEGPPIWIGGWGPRQVDRAARLADAWLPGPVRKLDEVAERQDAYDQALNRVGVDPLRRPRPITRDVIVAPTDAEAWALAFDHVLPSYEETCADDDSIWGSQNATESAADRMRSQLRQLAHDQLIIGSPSTVAAEAARCMSRLRADHLIIRLKLPGLTPGQMSAMLKLIGEQALPALRQLTFSDADR